MAGGKHGNTIAHRLIGRPATTEAPLHRFVISIVKASSPDPDAPPFYA